MSLKSHSTYGKSEGILYYIMYKETDLRERLFAYFSIGKLLQEIHKEETYQHQNNGL